MPAPFPHRYQTSIVRTAKAHGRIEASPRPALDGGPPPQFDGDDTSWSPEHLLLSSIGLCLLTTFEAFAARGHLEVPVWEARVNGTVEKTSSGLRFTKFTVQVENEADDVEQARATLASAKKHCLVSNALRVPVEIDAQIRPRSVRHAS